MWKAYSQYRTGNYQAYSAVFLAIVAGGIRRRRTESDRLAVAVGMSAASHLASCPSLLYRCSLAHRDRSCSRREMGGSTHFSVAAIRPRLDERPGKDPRKEPFQTSRNEQFDLDHDTCPGAPSQDKQGVGTSCCLCRKLLAAAGKRRHRTRKMVELQPPDGGDTRRGQELLAELTGRREPSPMCLGHAEPSRPPTGKIPKAAKQVRRWDRWNVLTASRRYYAVAYPKVARCLA
jgi:hypothetical protein